jgi:hypothetical protein
MLQVGAWAIEADTPQRLDRDRAFLEAHLEDWIERDPSLLSSSIRWVARQLGLPDTSRLDLLGLTQDGTWVIVELKAGSVDSATVRQVLHYFLEIAAMSNSDLVRRVRERGVIDQSVMPDLDLLAEQPEERSRDYLLLVAGVGSGTSAEATAAILSQHGFDVAVQVVTFELLCDSTGRRILIREITDEPTTQPETSHSRWTLDAVLERAEQLGVLPEFEAIRSRLTQRGYRCFIKKNGVQYNLGSRRQCFWVRPAEQAIHIGYMSWNFPDLFGVDEQEAETRLGPNWIDLPPEEARERIFHWADLIAAFRGNHDADAT